jgi:hypothetical protein
MTQGGKYVWQPMQFVKQERGTRIIGYLGSFRLSVEPSWWLTKARATVALDGTSMAEQQPR